MSDHSHSGTLTLAGAARQRLRDNILGGASSNASDLSRLRRHRGQARRAPRRVRLGTNMVIPTAAQPSQPPSMNTSAAIGDSKAEVTRPRKHRQVLGADLNCSESRRLTPPVPLKPEKADFGLPPGTFPLQSVQVNVVLHSASGRCTTSPGGES